jgi:serine/threonine-protein kinase
LTKLRILGSVSLVRADGSDIRRILTQPKLLALLTYLAVAKPRGFHRRDTLLGLFWPDQDQRRARASLRKAVHVLRRALGAEVVVARGDEELGVAPEHFWCDAVAFELAASSGSLGHALELYAGDLLEGFFVAGAPEFERWHEGERARLRDCAAQQAWALAERAAAEARPADAARWARRAVGFTPDDETALRDLVSLLYRVGDRASALRAYDAFASRLEQEFGTRPSALTRRLVEDVRLSKEIAVPRELGRRRSEASG